MRTSTAADDHKRFVLPASPPNYKPMIINRAKRATTKRQLQHKNNPRHHTTDGESDPTGMMRTIMMMMAMTMTMMNNARKPTGTKA